MLTLRYYLRLTKAFIYRFKGTIFLSVVIGFTSFFIIAVMMPRLSNKSIEIIGITGRYRPDELPVFILDKIGNGLTKIGDDGSPVPDIAEKWETPDKGKTWTFHLNENILWHDGKRLISDDIVYEFNDVEIERPNENIIVFKLQDPYMPFPSVVSKQTFRKGLLGTGLWRVDKIKLSGSFVQQLTLVNENKRKIYKFYPTTDRTKLAFKLGEVDILERMFDPKPFDTWNNVDIEQSQNYFQLVTLFINNEDPNFIDKSLRQSLAYAINKNGFEGDRAISPISKKSWAFNSQVKDYEYDPERAKEIISELSDEQKENMHVKLVTTPVLLPVAEMINEYWEAVGLRTSVQVSSVIPTDFQAYLAIFETPYDPDQYPIWHSTQTDTNISKYKNERIDKLLEDGRIELDTQGRRKIYIDFQRFLLEDSPAVFLYHPATYKIIRK